MPSDRKLPRRALDKQPDIKELIAALERARDLAAGRHEYIVELLVSCAARMVSDGRPADLATQLVGLLAHATSLATRGAAIKPKATSMPRATRALRSALIAFLDQHNPRLVKSLRLLALSYERIPRVRQLGARALEGARDVRRDPHSPGPVVAAAIVAALIDDEEQAGGLRRRLIPSYVVAASLIGLAHSLGLAEPGMRRNPRALIRLCVALENKRSPSSLELAKLVLEAAGVTPRNALDWKAAASRKPK